MSTIFYFIIFYLTLVGILYKITHMKMKRRVFTILIVFGFLFLYGFKSTIAPPLAGKIAKVDTLFGEIRVDNYYWLRNRDDPAVVKYLSAENDYTEKMMAHTLPLQHSLYKEMLARIKETDVTVPVKMGDYYYYTRTEKGKEYPIYCRKYRRLSNPQEVILDQNRLAKGKRYFDIGVLRVSPDNRYLAYTVDTAGNEIYTLYIKDLKEKKLLPDRIENIGGDVVWANDNQTIFYTGLDSTRRPARLFRYRLFDLSKAQPVYEETDPAYYLNVSKTRDKRYILLESSTHTTNEIYFLDADNPSDSLRIFARRLPEVEYYIVHQGDRFFILTNEDAENFKLLKTPVSDIKKENWSVVIPESDTIILDGVEAFKNYLVVYERINGLKEILVIDLHNDKRHLIDFPEAVYTVWPGRNPEFDSDTLRFNYTSLITPYSVFDYNMKTHKRILKKRYEVRGYNPEEYQSVRLLARARDGTRIPISIVFKKDMLKKNGLMILTGYGAYGSIYEPYFSSSRLSLLNRGFSYAIAHIRGGGEMGKRWYNQGRLLNRMNTFTDFIDCAEYLIAQGYTDSAHLVITGGSAGGMLIGAVVNMRPELFYGAVLKVPFVDVLNTMLDPSLPLTVLEYNEWGNPHKKEYYELIRAYSPYDNIRAQAYPNMLVLADWNDTRVCYWEAAKWVAKLRSLKTDQNILLLKTNMQAGHMGRSGRYEYLKDIVFEYAFILELFGINK